MRAHRLALVLIAGLLPACPAVSFQQREPRSQRQRGLHDRRLAGGQEAAQAEVGLGGLAGSQETAQVEVGPSGVVDGQEAAQVEVGLSGLAGGQEAAQVEVGPSGSAAQLGESKNRSHVDKKGVYRAERHGRLKDVCYAGEFDDPRSEACLQGQRLLFLHIPKNAGSGIEDAASKEGLRWGRMMDFAGCDLGAKQCRSKWHTPPALMNEINVYSDASVFCVVRNPFARAVSEYKWVVQRVGKHGATGPYSFPHEDVVIKFGCSPRGLNEWLAVSVREFAGGNFSMEDCHLIPQAFYIWGPPDGRGEQCQYCHEILRLEEFPRSFDALMDRYGYSVRLAAKRANEGACPELGMKDLNATTLRLLQSVYQDDFRMLDYPTEVL